MSAASNVKAAAQNYKEHEQNQENMLSQKDINKSTTKLKATEY